MSQQVMVLEETQNPRDEIELVLNTFEEVINMLQERSK